MQRMTQTNDQKSIPSCIFHEIPASLKMCINEIHSFIVYPPIGRYQVRQKNSTNCLLIERNVCVCVQCALNHKQPVTLNRASKLKVYSFQMDSAMTIKIFN